MIKEWEEYFDKEKNKFKIISNWITIFEWPLYSDWVIIQYDKKSILWLN